MAWLAADVFESDEELDAFLAQPAGDPGLRSVAPRPRGRPDSRRTAKVQTEVAYPCRVDQRRQPVMLGCADPLTESGETVVTTTPIIQRRVRSLVGFFDQGLIEHPLDGAGERDRPDC